MRQDHLKPDLSSIHLPGEVERLRAEIEALKKRLDSPRAKKVADFVARDIEVRSININGETYIAKNDLVFVLAAKANHVQSEEVKKFINNLIIDLTL